MPTPPGPETQLCAWPWVLVRFRCRRCKRWGDARTATLASKFGHLEPIGELVARFHSTCPWIARTKDGRPILDQIPCEGYCPDIGSTMPPDVPPSMAKLRVVEGGAEEMLPAERAEPAERRRRQG